jgi:hypothetical protein
MIMSWCDCGPLGEVSEVVTEQSVVDEVHERGVELEVRKTEQYFERASGHHS